MTARMAGALLPFIHMLDAERAHWLGLRALNYGFGLPRHTENEGILQTEALGLRFRNPIGLAAGFDKDAEILPAMERLGFGFLEAGTVTLRPQPGNPRPRLFRLAEDRALINRMGFNSGGIEQFVSRLRTARPSVPLGANIGINKEHADPARDYPALVAALSQWVDYIVLNVSSPNTPGLRDLQAAERLKSVLDAITTKAPQHPLLLVKIAPDLTNAELAALIDTCTNSPVKGLIVSNTTVSRPPGIHSRRSREIGGLSGRPLFFPSTRILARARLLAGDRLTLIGVGGIFSGQDALMKIMAGATLVQIYTALVYEGPLIVQRIKKELASLLRTKGFSRLSNAIGVAAKELADGTK